jgi:hypothetical protein
MFGSALKKLAPAIQKAMAQKSAPGMAQRGSTLGAVNGIASALQQKVGNAMNKPMMAPKSGNLGDMLVKKGRPAPAGAMDGEAPSAAYKKGGSVGSASKRADGIATKGKTRGKIC